MAAGLAGYATAHSLAGLLPPTAIWTAWQPSAIRASVRGSHFTRAAGQPLRRPHSAGSRAQLGDSDGGCAVLRTQVIGSLGPAALWSGCAPLCAADELRTASADARRHAPLTGTVMGNRRGSTCTEAAPDTTRAMR